MPDVKMGQHRSAMVTGAARGIGRAIAMRLAEDGLDVSVTDLPNAKSELGETVKVISSLGVKSCAILMDISSEGDVDRAVAVIEAGDRLGYVHIGESHRGYLGTGNVDFDTFFGALKKINYSGPITFESFSSVVVDPALSNALCIWRNLWNDSDDLASHALKYMKARY